MLNVDPAASTSVSVNGLTLSQLDLKTACSNLALSRITPLASPWREGGGVCIRKIEGPKCYRRANRSFLYIKASHCVGKDTRATS